jgi:hypothetical protein
VDCAGIETFAEDLDTTRQIYERDPSFPKDIPFDEAWNAVGSAVILFSELGVLPFAFATPDRHFQTTQNNA